MSDEKTIDFTTIDLIDVLGDNGFENVLTTTDIYEPCWLIAGTMTEADREGQSWKFVYRSVELRDHDGLVSARYKRLTDFIDGAPLIGEPQVIEDEMMMFGQAELACYGVPR